MHKMATVTGSEVALRRASYFRICMSTCILFLEDQRALRMLIRRAWLYKVRTRVAILTAYS